jgi:hypothetical protein
MFQVPGSCVLQQAMPKTKLEVSQEKLRKESLL